ncbi:MAG: HAMP domain-containing histidine kinase [Clostridia bacterium]|nr:HAMP domain-containing histidine kinase [Clostridia bacterium]
MYKSTFSKYLSIISLVVVLGFLAMTLLQVFLAANAMADEKKDLLLKNAESVATQTAAFANVAVAPDGSIVYRLDGARLSPLLTLISESIDASLFITDGSGDVLMAAGTANDRRFEREVVLRDFVSQVEDEYYTIGTLDNLFDLRHYIAAVPVELEGGAVVGYVVACTPANALTQIVRSNLSIYLYSVLGALVLSLAVVWFISDRFVRPLREMASAARSFAEGDFSPRVKVKGKDEVAQLGEALNGMATSLSSVEMMRRSFIANVSHELKTPMTTIAGFIDGMLDGTIPQEKQPQYMKIVSDEVKRLSRLVRSMLDLSRIDSGEIKMNTVKMDLTEVMCNVLVASEQRIEKKQLSVTGMEECESVEVHGDYDLLNQVLYNLVDNAIKFTDEGGNIHVRLYREDERVYVSIRNTGEGIPSDEMPQIFERFYKSDRSRSMDKNGVGLGLYIVHTVIRLHGGEIAVRSVQGEYTEFCFWLPENRKT